MYNKTSGSDKELTDSTSAYPARRDRVIRQGYNIHFMKENEW